MPAKVLAAIRRLTGRASAIGRSVRGFMRRVLAWVRTTRLYQKLDAWRYDPREVRILDLVAYAAGFAILVFFLGVWGIWIVRAVDVKRYAEACTAALKDDQRQIALANEWSQACEARLTTLATQAQLCGLKPNLVSPAIPAGKPSAEGKPALRSMRGKAQKSTSEGYRGPRPW